jgi:integrase
MPRYKLTVSPKKNKPGNYFVNVFENGVRIKRLTEKGSKKAVELRRDQYLAELMSGDLSVLGISEKAKIVAFDRLVSDYLDARVGRIRDSSMRRYKNFFLAADEYLKKEFRAVHNDISKMQPHYLEKMFSTMLDKKGWHKKTVNELRVLLSSLFNFAIDRDYVIKNPVRKTKPYPIPRESKPILFYTDEQLKQIWDNVDPFYLPHLQFLYLTGLRKAELINLVWDNIDLKSDPPRINIRSTEDWETKTGNWRMVPLNDKALDIVKSQQNIHEKWVFVSKRGQKIHPDQPYRKLKEVLTELGLQGNVHTLRHTFAAKLVSSGKDLYTVAKLLGHSDIKNTQIYAHLAPEYLKGAVDLLV